MDLPLGQGVQGGKGLVQQHHAPGAQEGPEKGCPLAHPAGELGGVLVLGPLQAKLGKVAPGLFPGRSGLLSPDDQGEGHIVQDLLVGEQQVPLEHVADLSRPSGDVLPLEEDPALLRPLQAGEGVEQGGLPRPADPQEADQLPGLQMDGDIPDDDPAVIGFGDALRLEGGDRLASAHSGR